METPSKSFCVAPWVHAHVSANGGRRLCAIAERIPKEYSQMPWSEFKNSDYMKQVRKSMLEGKTLSECKACDNANKTESTREELNKYYADEISNMISSTDAEGVTSCQTRYLDYRHSLCNLKCRTCSPFSSSAYYFHMLKQKREDVMDLFGALVSEYTKKLLPSFVDHFANEYVSFVENENLNRIYFAGGEPLLDPKHFEVLDRLLAKNQKVDVIYNTNLMMGPQKCQNWIEKINQLQGSVKLCVSFDGTHEVGEYIRQGSKFEVIDKNLTLLMQMKKPHVEVVLDMTLTSLNLFFLKDVAEYVIQKKISLFAKMMISGERYFPLLRLQTIPAQIKIQIVQRWRDYFNSLPAENAQYLHMFNPAIELWASRGDYEEVTPVYISKLAALENMYPEATKFEELLKRDHLGLNWTQELKIK